MILDTHKLNMTAEIFRSSAREICILDKYILHYMYIYDKFIPVLTEGWCSFLKVVALLRNKRSY